MLKESTKTESFGAPPKLFLADGKADYFNEEAVADNCKQCFLKVHSNGALLRFLSDWQDLIFKAW